MRAQLYDEPPLTVSPSLAAAVGLNEAIILQQVHYWTQINEQTNKNFADGRYWVFHTYAAWEKDFPFWCRSTIRNTINRLEESGLLLSGVYNKMSHDRTKWYAIDYDKLSQVIADYEGHEAEKATG